MFINKKFCCVKNWPHDDYNSTIYSTKWEDKKMAENIFCKSWYETNQDSFYKLIEIQQGIPKN